MHGKAREPFRIISGGLAQSNTSMTPQVASGGQTHAASDISMAGDGGRLEKDGWLERACFRLAEIESLSSGWDGYQSDKPANTTVNFTAMVLAAVLGEAHPLPFPAITPMSSGSIMVEWRTGSHELTLEVNGPNDVQVLFEDLHTSIVEEFHVTSNFLKISDALEAAGKLVREVA